MSQIPPGARPDDELTALLRAHPESYRTLSGPAAHEIDVERSRFLCRLRPCRDEAEARAFFAEVRGEHPRARHHCTAMILGERGRVRRSNDDGEPAGTAGTPMLEALTDAALTDVAACVVRYYGGRLLGAGRLGRTYRRAVAEMVALACVRERVLRVRLNVRCPMPAVGALEATCARRGWTVIARDWDAAGASYALAIAPDDLAAAREQIALLSGGAAAPTIVGVLYVDAGRSPGR